jgi:hypothetical protein
MKKIYMILAAIALLSMSLNAQLLPKHVSGTTQYSVLSASPTGTAVNKGQSRAPLRLNQGEYTMGPFEGDNLWQGGIGYVNYPDPQWVLASAVLNRDEFIGHEGDTIVGFRFALAGNPNQTVRLSEFSSIFLSQNGYFDFDNSYFWPIAGIGNNSGNVETITTEAYQDILITLPHDLNVRSITLTRSDDNDITWNSLTATTTTYSYNGTNYASYNLPDGWTLSSEHHILRWTDNNNGGYLGYIFENTPGIITIPASLLTGNSSVSLTINAYTDTQGVGITVNDETKQFTTTTLSSQTWNIEPTETTSYVVTVGNGATESGDLPVYGYEQDYGYTTQMIYSASQLGMTSGTEITSITFYPREGFGINFWGSTVTISLGNTSVSDYGTGSTGTAITGLTAVASKQITATDPNCTAWTFTFDQPFTYTGQNLVVQVSCPGYRYDGTNQGQWATSHFMGDNQSSNVSLLDEDGGPSNFLPKASFGFNGSAGGGDYVDLAGGQWYDYYLDEPVLFTVPGDTVDRLLIGFDYLQYPSTATDQNCYPLAVNDQSTDHNHIFYMYLQTSEGTQTTTTGTATVADGTTTVSNRPVYGLYQDWGYHNQMIYPASLLGDLQAGDEITSLTFYPSNGIRFAASTITFKLCNTTTQNFGTTTSNVSPISMSGDIVTATVAPTQNTSATTWTITFSSPLTYTGGNLLLDVYCVGYSHDSTTGGSATTTNFYGAEQANYQSFGATGTNNDAPTTTKTGTITRYLPKTTFSYERTTGSPATYQQGWWGLDLSSYGDLAVQLILKPGKEKTPTPTITYTYDNGYYYITATATGENADNATVTLTVNGTTATGTHSVTIPVGRLNGENNDYTVNATATAVEPDKLPSDQASATITVEGTILDPTPTPTIDTQVLDLTVQVSGSGTGEVHMYIDGKEVTIPTNLERTDEEYTVQVTVTAQITDGEHSMASTTQTVVVPPLTDLDLTGWTQLPGLFNNDEVIVWDNNLMFVDRFIASTAHNDHPTQYKYVMTENNTKLYPPLRTTNEHFVPVQRTNSKVMGYYTEQDVLLDRDRNHVDLNVMNADVEMYLENNNDIYFYTLDRSKDNKDVDEYYLPLTELQNAGNNYVEMNDYYTLYEPFVFGKAMRFDTINAALPATIDQGIDGKHYGAYDMNFMSYVPIVWTFGNKPSNKRANWDVDHKHNSYGSPIWQTGVGKTNLNYIKIERQDGKDGSTNWNMDSVAIYEQHYYAEIDTLINGQTQHWVDTTTVDTIWHYTPCSLFMVKRIEVDGFLPSNISNIKYEPYMFRVWVTSPTHKLRNFSLFPADSSAVLPGQHYGDTINAHVDGPFCIWEEYFSPDNENINIDTDNPYIYHFIRDKVEHTDSLGNWDVPDSMNMIFAAEDSITYQDVVFYVRFYYRSTGEARGETYTMTFKLGNRDGEEASGPREYYGVEDNGNPDREIPTSIKSVYDLTQGHGEVVSVTYYNLQGVESKTPFDGINIVVTRYSDGTASSRKIVRVR